jgi:hypothetical protein
LLGVRPFSVITFAILPSTCSTSDELHPDDPLDDDPDDPQPAMVTTETTANANKDMTLHLRMTLPPPSD